MGCCSKTKETKVRPFQANDSSEEDIPGEFVGPLENRQCRDVIFLILFLAFITGIGGLAYFGVTQGNPYRLVYGVDSYGNVCGQDNEKIPDVLLSGQNNIDKSNVFFFDSKYFTTLLPNNPFPSFNLDETEIICIEKCPTEEVKVLDYYNNHGINLCLYNITPYVDNLKLCPATPVPKHVTIFNRCIPESVVNAAKSMATSFTSVLGSGYLGSNFPQKVVSDLKNTWREIGYLAILAVCVSFLIVLLMRFLAAVIIWTLVIVVTGFSFGASAYCWYSWYGLRQEFNKLPENKQTEEAEHSVFTWLIYSAIASVITIIISLILLVLRKRISLVIQLYKEAGKAIQCLPFMLLLPLWTLTILIISIGGLCFLASFIETSGLPQKQSNGHVKFVMESFWVYLRWYNIFAILWISSFIAACQDIVIAGAVATWFFTRNKKKLGFPISKSVRNLFRYHVGSVAFGSFIIALVKLAREILGFVQAKLQKRAGKVVDFLLKCLQCCLWCFERFLKYLNRNAYIEIAIYGYSFCQAAKKAFLLIVANALRVAAINSIGDFVLFLGKLSAVAVVMVVGNEMMQKRSDINFIWVPLSVACGFTFAITHCFLLVYEITIDTIFLCFCEDCERNDGQSRPYFMSKNLMIYLDKSDTVTQTTSKRKKQQTTKM